ncbi:MAG: sigma-70 family RNA polymerase sigma factor, partial [Ferruginibacter sp.]
NNKKIELILNGCRLNQRAAQKELYYSYYSFAMSIALRYSASYDNSVEMVNDAFLRVYRDLKNYVPLFDTTAGSFVAWLKNLVVNACIDYNRKYSKKEIMAGVDIEKGALADERENDEQMSEHKLIIKSIQKLPPAYKLVYNLYVIEGFSHVEIADKLNISEVTSKSNLFKARQMLMQLLKEHNIVSVVDLQVKAE